jgi:hypothetical protein
MFPQIRAVCLNVALEVAAYLEKLRLLDPQTASTTQPIPGVRLGTKYCLRHINLSSCVLVCSDEILQRIEVAYC